MFVVYDAEWQFPAITEQHAYHQAVKYLPTSDNAVYVAFPWATLFDAEARGAVHLAHLKDELLALKSQIPVGKRVVTVCQHIDLLKFLHILSDFGITDVFWSHAVGKGTFLPGSSIRSWPFPLYPVQKVPALPVQDRDLLFSFVGAASNQWYLTHCRAWIGECLSQSPEGYICLREKWHFNKVVYDHQIHARIDDAKEPLTSEAASREYADVLSRSQFALCPSGTGPNSIRLWECVHAGIIPVILSDTYLPPGLPSLWQQAAVFCGESREAITELPDRLKEIAANSCDMERRLDALRQIRFCYGINTFVYDLVAFFSNPDVWLAPNEILPEKQCFYSPSDRNIPGFTVAEKTQRSLYMQSMVTALLLEPEKTRCHIKSIAGAELSDNIAAYLSGLDERDRELYRELLSSLEGDR
ncbi:exostosin domain-containing protein [Marinimicrobium alkaliphilum]|uniref:exostosin domain-containing protein n=1 Tax=Marinimicrobium alkaliphilum TaxID=2202654 RepID=UPI000DB9259E|nr:exostosin family protein [Marinimicrobium alkaliphilum]